MRYFITEQERKRLHSTGFFEFQKGVEGLYQKNRDKKDYKHGFWLEDSLLLHMDIADRIAMYKYIPGFDYYYITVVDSQKWSEILYNIQTAPAETRAVFEEVTPFAEESIGRYGYFLIVGI